MKTTFGFDIRVLMCANCGAPMELAPQGGSLYCGYCGSANQLRPRQQTALIPAARQPIDEMERLRRLRLQDGKPLIPPANVMALLDGGELAEWKVNEALALWQDLRRQLAGGQAGLEAGDQLVVLTMVMANYYVKNNELLKLRALYESGLEVCTLPRHQQVMRGYLARAAAKEGDLQAAEQWLAPCDPASDDLETDTAYRFSRAVIDTARQDWPAVLRSLGNNQKDVPIMDAVDAAATVFRANAWEKSGEPQTGARLLSQYMGVGGASGRSSLEAVIKGYEMFQLCPMGLAQAKAKYAQKAGTAAAARAGGGVGGVLFFIGIVSAVVAVVLLVGAFLGWGTGPAVLGPGISGVIMTLIGHRMRAAAKKAHYLRTQGIQTQGRVISVNTTGTRVNNVPMYRITLEIALPDRQPYQADCKLLLNTASAAQLSPGRSLPVRVDPQNPQSVLIELD